VPERTKTDLFAAVAVALLLVLTAIGNPVAMLVVSALALAVVLAVTRGRLQGGSMLAAAVGAVAAVVIALVYLVVR